MTNAALKGIRGLWAETTTPKLPKRITKKTVGHAVRWHGYDGATYIGRITEVRNRIASISYKVPGIDGVVVARVDTRDKHAVAHVEFI